MICCCDCNYIIRSSNSIHLVLIHIRAYFPSYTAGDFHIFIYEERQSANCISSCICCLIAVLIDHYQSYFVHHSLACIFHLLFNWNYHLYFSSLKWVDNTIFKYSAIKQNGVRMPF
jgi:hypothetical protein